MSLIFENHFLLATFYLGAAELSPVPATTPLGLIICCYCYPALFMIY